MDAENQTLNGSLVSMADDEGSVQRALSSSNYRIPINFGACATGQEQPVRIEFLRKPGSKHRLLRAVFSLLERPRA